MPVEAVQSGTAVSRQAERSLDRVGVNPVKMPMPSMGSFLDTLLPVNPDPGEPRHYIKAVQPAIGRS